MGSCQIFQKEGFPHLRVTRTTTFFSVSHLSGCSRRWKTWLSDIPHPHLRLADAWEAAHSQTQIRSHISYLKGRTKEIRAWLEWARTMRLGTLTCKSLNTIINPTQPLMHGDEAMEISPASLGGQISPHVTQ